MRSLHLASSSLVVLLFSSTVFLSACSSDGETRPEYLDATMTQNLEIPPQLTQPDTNRALLLPEPSEKAKNAFANASLNNADVKEIAPEFKGIRLKNNSGLYWLEIDSPVEKVWESLPQFLAAEGIAPERIEKLLGFVDTQWMDEYQASYGEQEQSSWLKKFSPDYKDKFRIRLETAGNNQTRLYVSHRGMQIIVTDDATEWVQRDSEGLLERELMYRYVLFAGANKNSATNLLAGYKSYQSRVIVNKDELSSFHVQGNANTVWNRLKIAMDRLGVDVLNTDAKNRRIDVLVGNLKTTKPTKSEDASWFSGFFGGDVIVDEEEGYESGSYKKAPVKEKNKIKLSLVQIPGEYVSEIKLGKTGEMKGVALDFRKALLNQLK